MNTTQPPFESITIPPTRSRGQRRLWRMRPWAALLLCGSLSGAHAGPTGMTVGQGQATASTSGRNLTLQVSDRTLLNWRTFNIAANESVTFVQPSAASIVWNRILDPNPSSIFGRLDANGIVVLQNSAGFYFGPNAFVSAGGLFITTTPAVPPDFGGGGSWTFNGPPPTASIVNYGELRTHTGGSMFLVAEKIENHGTLAAPGGTIGLLAGQEVLVSERPDGRGLSAEVHLPSGVVDNEGRLLADAGQVAMHARVVNQAGIIEANSVRERGGVIELVASDAVNLGAGSRIEARGPDGASGDGGQITIKSDRAFNDAPGSVLDVRGGAQGGNGGAVELSAREMPAVHSTLHGEAQPGWRGGSLYLDPTDILLGTIPEGTVTDGTVHASDPPDTLRLDVTTAFLGFANITLEASRDITLASSTAWNLNDSTGLSEPGSLLTLRAGRDITLQNNASLVAGANWSMTLTAGADFTAGGAARSGIGSIVLLPGASIEAQNGSIQLQAGQDVTVQSGFVHTVGGGVISVTALAGSVNTGTRPDGFRFSGTGYSVFSTLGGISTAAGGDVTITAGQDINSYLPTGASAAHSDGGSGAFGEQPGNVTLVAGRNVLGHYVVRNGAGTITAGQDAGTLAKQLALSLVTGSWDVTAAHDILLQEVRNPNGIFNNRGSSTALTRHLFDYDPMDFVRLKAGNAIQLLGAALPRNPSENINPIYPGSLSLDAGAGGVSLGNNVYLFPTAAGQLDIVTHDGGPLRSGQPGSVFELAMSDSSRTRWTGPADFTSADVDHTLLHQNDLTPVHIDVSGDVHDLSLWMPKPVDVRVAGEAVNTSLIAQNFRSTDISRLAVTGDIFNRNNWTFAFLDAAPDFNALANAVIPAGLFVNIDLLRGKFVYTPDTGRLAFQGRMTGAELNFLLTLQDKTFDSAGHPILDSQGNFITVPAVFVPESILRDLSGRSQDVPDLGGKGYQIGGPGRFEISGRNLDLGITEGIVSFGPAANHLLGPISGRGADIDLNLTGNLSMFASSIQSRAGGNVSVYADGAIDVGSQEVLASSETARGIYAAREGDVAVIARGNIQVNGSRIAAYSGGDVLVRSLEGNVNAGDGGVGFVRVQRVLVDPDSGAVTVTTRGIPGSGILATTFPDTPGTVGDITVETPKGDIVAGQGGIAQVSFNGTPNKDGVVSLTAGTLAGPNGEPEITGNIIARNSGVIGGNIRLKATGDIDGVVVAQGNLDISSSHNVNVTALAGGLVSVNAVGSVSGTIVGVAGVEAQGSSIDASLVSQNVSASGATTAATSDAGNASSAAAQAASAANTEKALAAANPDDDDEKKRKRGLPTLSRLQGRVTVILPER